MAWTVWDIADGQLSATPGTTILSVTQTGILGEILLTNTGASSVTTNIYINRTGTDRRVGGKDASIPAGGSKKLSLAVALKSGDIIKGDASSGSVVDYVISGVTDV